MLYKYISFPSYHFSHSDQAINLMIIQNIIIFQWVRSKYMSTCYCSSSWSGYENNLVHYIFIAVDIFILCVCWRLDSVPFSNMYHVCWRLDFYFVSIFSYFLFYFVSVSSVFIFICVIYLCICDVGCLYSFITIIYTKF